jgi:hypothetical protein
MMSRLAVLSYHPLAVRRRSYLVSHIALPTYRPLAVRRRSYLMSRLAFTYLPTSSCKEEDVSDQISSSLLKHQPYSKNNQQMLTKRGGHHASVHEG